LIDNSVLEYQHKMSLVLKYNSGNIRIWAKP